MAVLFSNENNLTALFTVNFIIAFTHTCTLSVSQGNQDTSVSRGRQKASLINELFKLPISRASDDRYREEISAPGLDFKNVLPGQ